MLHRPKIQLEISPVDVLLERAGMICLLILWGLTAYAYTSLPETIPTHFNFSGQPDSYGSKLMLLVLPVLGTLIFFGLGMLNKRPHIFNYPVSITEENARQQYGYVTRMIRILKTSVLLIFITIVATTVLTAEGRISGFGPWLIPCIILVLFLPIGYYISGSLKTK